MKFINQFIEGTDALGRIRLAARQLDSLSRRIRASVPAEIGNHVVGCALHPDSVVVFIDSAAWAAQLRYLQQNVLDVCQQAFGERIRRVQFRIQPSESPAGNPPLRKPPETARHVLEQAARGIADDDLAAALRRLSEKAGDQDAE